MSSHSNFIAYTLKQHKLYLRSNYWSSLTENKKSALIIDSIDITYNFERDFVIECYKKIITTTKTKIYFNNLGEAFPKIVLDYLTYISEALSKDIGLPANHFFYICGAANIPENVNSFDEAVKKYKWFNFKLILNDTYEIAAANEIQRNLTRYESNKNDDTDRQKLMLCFNRTPREHRCALISELYKNNLINKSYVSFYNHPPDIFKKFSVEEFSMFNIFFPAKSVIYTDVIAEHINELPLKLNLDLQYLNPHFVLDDLGYFQNSYFSLVTESKFFVDNNYDSLDWFDTTVDSYFFTEKIWKPITAKHAFILMGRPKSLYLLRRHGYKTFSPFIDETYDEIYDDNDRFDAIISEVVRLSNLNKIERINFINDILPIVNHNFNVLKTRGL